MLACFHVALYFFPLYVYSSDHKAATGVRVCVCKCVQKRDGMNVSTPFLVLCSMYVDNKHHPHTHNTHPQITQISSAASLIGQTTRSSLPRLSAFPRARPIGKGNFLVKIASFYMLRYATFLATHTLSHIPSHLLVPDLLDSLFSPQGLLGKG
jgi:hypothetical protein